MRRLETVETRESVRETWDMRRDGTRDWDMGFS